MVLSVLRLDMRSPAFSPASASELYAAALDMSVFAEEHNFLCVSVSEHHGVDDGFLPAPLSLAGVIAGRTRRIMINVFALLVPLHDPIRLAEELAVLDLASGGRIAITAGIGYRPEEYEMAGVEWRRRGKLLDEALDAMLAAWTGEEFTYRDRTVRVTPRPHTQPHPMVMVGGSGTAAARRAARLGLPFNPAINDPALAEEYTALCAEYGTTPIALMPGEAASVFVSEDPERTWAEIGDHLLYDARTYASWQTSDVRSQVASGAQTLDELRAEGKYKVLTPDECVAYAATLGPMDAIVHFPLCGGLPPKHGWESLELYAAKVLPHINT